MEIQEIIDQIPSFSTSERRKLQQELEKVLEPYKDIVKGKTARRYLLDNKMGSCPHCSHPKYVRFGKDKGAQRYKCKSCQRSFTEFTGTWMAGLHKKDKIDDYLTLMMEEKSLDKIKEALEINKKTAFDWRHKILASLSETDKNDFNGITESDETFFLDSQKGIEVKDRKPRKRGGKSTKRGVSQDQVAVIVTQDRNSSLDITVATLGRIKKVDIENAIGKRMKTGQSVLCSDAHVSYKGFAIDQKIEHHPLKAIIKQRVKDGVYHIQHVNSTHNRIKKWIGNTFWGVSTKYLQQYLNWYRVKESIKNSKDKKRLFVQKIITDVLANNRFKKIADNYEILLSTQS